MQQFPYSFQGVSELLNVPVTTLVNYVYQDSRAGRIARKFPDIWQVQMSRVIDAICHFNQIETVLGYQGRAVQLMTQLRAGKVRFHQDGIRVYQ